MCSKSKYVTISTKYLKEAKGLYAKSQTRCKDIWTPYSHTPYTGKETSISLTFHQTHHYHRKQLVQHGLYLALSPCGKDDQLGRVGERRQRAPKNERNVNPKAGENTSRMLNNRRQLESASGLSTALRPARDAVV